MTSPMDQQHGLVSYLDPQLAIKQGRGEMRDELLMDDLKSLPWQNEDDPYSARPASFPTQYQLPNSYQDLDMVLEAQNHVQGVMEPVNRRLDPPASHLSNVPHHGPLQAPGLQHLSQQALDGSQQGQQMKSKRAQKRARQAERRAAEMKGLEHLRMPSKGSQSNRQGMSKGARARARKAAERTELEHLRLLVYGPGGPVTAAAPPSSTLNRNQSALQSKVNNEVEDEVNHELEVRRRKPSRHEARNAKKEAYRAAERAKGVYGTRPPTEFATGANSATLVRNRMASRFAETEISPYGDKEDEMRIKTEPSSPERLQAPTPHQVTPRFAKIEQPRRGDRDEDIEEGEIVEKETMIKTEPNSPRRLQAYNEPRVQSSTELTQAALPHDNGRQMAHLEEVREVGAGANGAAIIPDQSTTIMLPSSDRDPLGEVAEGNAFLERMDEEIMTGKYHFAGQTDPPTRLTDLRVSEQRAGPINVLPTMADQHGHPCIQDRPFQKAGECGMAFPASNRIKVRLLSSAVRYQNIGPYEGRSLQDSVYLPESMHMPQSMNAPDRVYIPESVYVPEAMNHSWPVSPYDTTPLSYSLQHEDYGQYMQNQIYTPLAYTRSISGAGSGLHFESAYVNPFERTRRHPLVE